MVAIADDTAGPMTAMSAFGGFLRISSDRANVATLSTSDSLPRSAASCRSVGSDLIPFFIDTRNLPTALDSSADDGVGVVVVGASSPSGDDDAADRCRHLCIVALGPYTLASRSPPSLLLLPPSPSPFGVVLGDRT